MPNTLAHLGIQSLLTRAGLPGADLKWVWAACVLPDLPWILQRVVRAAVPEIPPFDLRLYAIVQSSLAVVLVLAAGLALLSRTPRRTFAILAAGVLMHLLLDATQTKWANGAILFAPFSWELTNFRLYWPEAWPTYLLTVLGAGYVSWALWRERPAGVRPISVPPLRLLAAAALIAAHVFLPVVWMAAAAASDPHYVATLRNVADRPGKPIEIDRETLLARTGGPEDGPAVLRLSTGPELVLLGEVPGDARQVSVGGHFVDTTSIALERLHVHPAGRREIASLLGLLVVAGWWAAALLRRRPEA